MNYFRYKQFDKDVITVAVGYYLRYALSPVSCYTLVVLRVLHLIQTLNNN